MGPTVSGIPAVRIRSERLCPVLLKVRPEGRGKLRMLLRRPRPPLLPLWCPWPTLDSDMALPAIPTTPIPIPRSRLLSLRGLRLRCPTTSTSQLLRRSSSSLCATTDTASPCTVPKFHAGLCRKNTKQRRQQPRPTKNVLRLLLQIRQIDFFCNPLKVKLYTSNFSSTD